MTKARGWQVAIAVVAAAFAVPLLIILVILPTENRCVPNAESVSATKTIDGYTATQIALARLTVEVGRQRGISDLGITAALLAATTESDLRNLANANVPESLRYDHDGIGADHDSVGPWQLRASLHGAVGIAQLMNPGYQVHWFYDQLDAIRWQTMTAEQIAQAVERSARPDAYSRNIDRVAGLIAAIAPMIGTLTTECAIPVPNGDGFGQRVLAAAARWIGTEYVWGGGDETGPTSGGFDCSGLVLHAVHVASGGTIALPHYTQAQQDDPRGAIVAPNDRRPGDLIYFTIPGQSDSHHVAIYAGEIDGIEMVLHAATFGVPVGYSPLSQWSGEVWDVRRFAASPQEAVRP